MAIGMETDLRKSSEDSMKHAEKIAADKTALGFDFQNLVFVEKLINLKIGQTLGLELHDDIHAETAANDGSISELLLIQVKHAINEDNLTERDIDLWKTMSNWLKLIPSLPSSDAIRFQLYTNKRLNNQPLIKLLRNPAQNAHEIIKQIRSINEKVCKAEAKKGSKESPNPIAKYTNHLSQQKDGDLEYLIERVELHSDTSSVIERISSSLLQLAVPEARLGDTRKYVIGAFEESKFSKIKKGEKVLISFDDFRTEMGFNRIIRSARSDSADFGQFVDYYYNHQRSDLTSFKGSKFCEQLKDINIGEDEIIERGVEMMAAQKFMDSLREEGTFSASEDARLENMAVSDWQLIHRQCHRRSDEDDGSAHKEASQDCYDRTMQKPLKANNIELPIRLSCGKYIKLSDLPRIGWRKDWEGKFK